MKVLLLIEQYVIERSGNEFFHNSLSTVIERFKILGDITLCCRVIDRQPSFSPILSKPERVVEIKKSRSGIRRLYDLPLNKPIVRNEIDKCDLLIAYVPSFLASYAAKYAKKVGKPTLLIGISCPWDALFYHSFWGKIAAPFCYLAMRKSMAKTDFAMYVTSEFLQRRYPCKGLSVGVSDVRIQPGRIELLEERLKKISAINDIKSETINLVTCAAVNVKYKRQADVIRAIAILKEKYNLRYYLIGGGNNTPLKELSESLGVSDRVVFLGKLNHDELFARLEEMDIYIQPSKQEGLPRALVEAMSIGLPAIGSNAGGIPELLDADYIFKKGDVKGLCNVLEKINSVENLMTQAKRNYRVAQFYSPELLTRKYIDFLNMVKARLG